MLLGTPLQQAYVTNDMDRACVMLGDKFGISQYMRMDNYPMYADSGDEMVISMAHCWVGSVWVEVIQPVGGAVDFYRSVLPAEGFGVRFHHVAIRTPTLAAWEEMLAGNKAKGQKLIFTSKNAQAYVAYFDTTEDLGHYVEYLHFPDPLGSMMSTMPQNIPGHVVDVARVALP